MSLLLVTGAIAEPPGNRPPNVFADFGDFDVMATALKKNVPSTQTTPTITQAKPSTPTTLLITLDPGVSATTLLKAQELNSRAATATPPQQTDVSEDPLKPATPNELNRLGLTNDNDLIF
jgi:hypothetical protein